MCHDTFYGISMMQTKSQSLLCSDSTTYELEIDSIAGQLASCHRQSLAHKRTTVNLEPTSQNQNQNPNVAIPISEDLSNPKPPRCMYQGLEYIHPILLQHKRLFILNEEIHFSCQGSLFISYYSIPMP